MSGCTCESCGNTAERSSDNGWVRTMCQPCLDKREQERAKQMAEWEQERAILKQGYEQ